jgi:hypothetical protein
MGLACFFVFFLIHSNSAMQRHEPILLLRLRWTPKVLRFYVDVHLCYV